MIELLLVMVPAFTFGDVVRLGAVSTSHRGIAAVVPDFTQGKAKHGAFAVCQSDNLEILFIRPGQGCGRLIAAQR